eukprot:s4179_g2.t1
MLNLEVGICAGLEICLQIDCAEGRILRIWAPGLPSLRMMNCELWPHVEDFLFNLQAFGGDVEQQKLYECPWHPSDQPTSPKAKSRTLLTRTSKVFFATATARMTGFLLLPQCDSIPLSSWASFCTATCCRSDAGPDGRSLVESDIPTILRQIQYGGVS